MSRSEGGAGIESGYAWARLSLSLVLATIGGSAMEALSLVLPRVRAESGVTRAIVASLIHRVRAVPRAVPA